jgi:hypothetical protein
MDESKLPYMFFPDPELVGIKPLICSPLNTPRIQFQHDLDEQRIEKDEFHQQDNLNAQNRSSDVRQKVHLEASPRELLRDHPKKLARETIRGPRSHHETPYERSRHVISRDHLRVPETSSRETIRELRSQEKKHNQGQTIHGFPRPRRKLPP